jgi:flavin reductase (DIM6/NTAB) family NADH-FMN oxidoreductase RutF
MVANGEPPRLLALLDPESELLAALRETGTAVVHVLAWEHRQLAEMFAGTAPAPGGPFRQATFEDTAWGPALADAPARAGVRLEGEREVGWSVEVACVVEDVVLGEDAPPLLHHRGRWRQVQPGR